MSKIDYVYRKPNFPIICNLDGTLIIAQSATQFQQRVEAVTIKADECYKVVDVTGAEWELYTGKMYIVPTLRRKWSKKRIIQMYNDSLNCHQTGQTYSEKSLSSKRFETVYSEIITLIEKSL